MKLLGQLSQNSMLNRNSFIFILILLLQTTRLQAQESVFSAFNQTIADADKAFIAKNYSKALLIYEDIAKKSNSPDNIDLRLARSYYFTYEYNKAVDHYEQYEKTNLEFPDDDYFYYAEALNAIKRTPEALKYYQLCLEKKPSNGLYAERIWRLNNISYLYEDSVKNMAHYAKINTKFSELQMLNGTQYEVYLISNQPQVEIVRKIDTKENAPFYNLRRLSTYEDPFSIVALNYENPKYAGQHLKTQFHLTAISFFDDGKQMVFAASAKQKNANNNYPLQLFFAKKKGEKWVKTAEYAHNDLRFDLTEPTINNDGNLLVFSADFENSVGGKDLFLSVKTDEGWSLPEKLDVNTELDERFPFINNNNLYFASNGHPGLGGFDLYKTKLTDTGIQDIQNLGYPINSTFDDLSLTIDSLGQQGFLSSNRKHQGFNFDIYEFALDLQIYPLTVKGVVKFIEHNWMDSTELKVLSDVEMELIDRVGNKVILKTVTDNNGRFTLDVPYYSQYKIRIKDDNLDGFVSFEVPKFAKQDLSYEIVVVNDDFKNSLREGNE